MVAERVRIQLRQPVQGQLIGQHVHPPDEELRRGLVGGSRRTIPKLVSRSSDILRNELRKVARSDRPILSSVNRRHHYNLSKVRGTRITANEQQLCIP